MAHRHHERQNTAHNIFLEFHKHRPQSLRKIKEEENEADLSPSDVPMDFDMFQHVMKTGVIYATSRARGHGFDPEDPGWVSFVHFKTTLTYNILTSESFRLYYLYLGKYGAGCSRNRVTNIY